MSSGIGGPRQMLLDRAEVADLQLITDVDTSGAPQERLDPGQQLVESERLIR
jgi:hypothetical protein